MEFVGQERMGKTRFVRRLQPDDRYHEADALNYLIQGGRTAQARRDPPSFANINLLGPCNARCFFCIGKELESELAGQNQLDTPFFDWPHFFRFLGLCRFHGVQKLYITGQNTDALMYSRLPHLVDWLQDIAGFDVGLRTNGYLAPDKLETINACHLETGYTMHSLHTLENARICGRRDLPDWQHIIPATKKCRISIVVNRHNVLEVLDIVKYVSSRFPHVPYIQLRQVWAGKRKAELQTDIDCFEWLYQHVYDRYVHLKTLWGDADVFEIEHKEVCFWRTVATTINSLNYFTDGTISDDYCVVQGWLDAHQEGSRV